MDIDSIFKTPTAPATKGGAKRKLVSPDEMYRKNARHTSYEELTGRSFDVDASASGDGSVPSKRRTVSIQDADDEDMEGERFEGVANPEEEEEDDRFFGDGLTSDQKDILDYVDDIDPDEEKFDIGAVRKMILKFEKAINKNQEMRVKYPDDPSKFMESEADLDEEIKHLMAMTQAPEHYPVLVELSTVSSILSLLTHENMDIAIDAIELLKELTDEEVLEVGMDEEEGSGTEAVEGMKVFVSALLEQGLLDLLVQNMSRLDEEEANDRLGVFNTLAILENLTGIDVALAETVVQKSTFLPWIMKRLKVKTFDSNKQYCSEILSILLQSSSDNRKKLGELGGIDDLLQLLATYKRKDPKDPDEIEMMENLFDGLCSALAEKENKRLFLEGEGIELMVIMIKEKKMARIRAVKVLDYAMSTKAGTANCLRFVEIMGLKTLFSIFSRKGVDKLKKAYKSFSEVEEEEHIIGIMASLVRNLPLESGHRLRVVRKFVEEDYSKLERLLDLREGYEARVNTLNEKFEQEDKEEGLDAEDIAELEDERSLQRLESGLFVMQLIDIIIAHLCAENLDLEEEETTPAVEKESDIKARVRMLLNRRGQSLDDIKDNLQAYLNGLEVNTALAEEARTKLLSESGAGPLTDGAAAEQDEEGEIKAKISPVELTQEEETALEALEAKEFVQYVLGLL
ncbi:beta-catenin-like protein 1 [Entomortierella parvispora]|uniref:Beta-catenin-like protein 1 n=1 Tax=Entomortierella parvispora TaxID=205924 RepID=A0A9P3H179_9FUNG|nr:beta-catenin-like protein 1 [Entomortierella parvispora]